MLTVCGYLDANPALARNVSFLPLWSRSHPRVMYQLGSHRSHAMLLPVMSTRLMLSLRKAAARPAESWSLSTMGERSKGRSTGDGIRHFVPQKFKVSQETSTTLVPPSTEDIELDSAYRLPRNRGTQLPC